ncbi:MAG: hypothetical protein IPM84_03460 [Anaerolineae bacterium]|nr:hypothetical protein [Anaerolineae bacterium]
MALDMPEETYAELEQMVLDNDPRIAHLRILELRKIIVAEQELSATWHSYPDYDYDYEYGLDQLRGMISQSREEKSEFSTLEDRLIIVLRDIRLFGPSSDARTEQSRVVHSLNQLAKELGSEKSFTDLCKRPHHANKRRSDWTYTASGHELRLFP